MTLDHDIPVAVSNPIITINCGGRFFQTFRDVGEQFRVFSCAAGRRLCRVLVGWGGGSGNPYFLDMNPKYFAMLLDRMRYGLTFSLPATSAERNGLQQVAEFLGVEYRNADEIEREEKELQARAAEIEKTQKDLDRQARLLSLKEAGLVDYLVMCVDTLQQKCLARIIDVDDTKNEYLIHYEHFAGTRFDEWIAKTSSRISQIIERCDCRNSRCPDSGQNTYTFVNNTASTATIIGSNAFTRITTAIPIYYTSTRNVF